MANKAGKLRSCVLFLAVNMFALQLASLIPVVGVDVRNLPTNIVAPRSLIRADNITPCSAD